MAEGRVLEVILLLQFFRPNLNKLLGFREVPSNLTELNLLLSAKMLPDSGGSGAALRCCLHPR